MNALISNPADCEVRGVIRFLQVENVRPFEIHQRLVAVYGEHVMNAASVRKWCIMFTNGRTDVHDAEKSGGLQHAVVDWLNSQAAVWYKEGISKLVSRYDRCLNVQGDYVEK
jgi:hypothetical protein